MSVVERVPSLDAQHPWPGLLPFTESVQQYFHGRDDEIEDMARLLRRSTLTVLFGRSGLGKTSLLQAGLFPRLRQIDHFPLYLRIDWASTTLSPLRQLMKTIEVALAGPEVGAPTPQVDETPWSYFHRSDVDFWTPRNRPMTPVLVFDQFEEIFTRCTDAAARTAFIEALADLVENRVSPSIAEALTTADVPLPYDLRKSGCRVVVSFREDYLAYFEDLRNVVPSIMTNRMRLGPMTGRQALEAVVEAAPELLDETTGQRIVRFVSGGRKDAELAALEVEPSLLSMVCRELNGKRIAARLDHISADLLDTSQADIIEGFYADNTKDIDPDTLSLLEDRLVSLSGHRESPTLDNLLEARAMNRKLIDLLVDRRLVRLEDRMGALRVELTHDLLAPIVVARRQLARVQREQKRRTRWFVAITSVSVLLAAFSIYLYTLKHQAEASLKVAIETTSSMIDFIPEIVTPTGSIEVAQRRAKTALDQLKRTANVGGDFQAVRAKGLLASAALIELTPPRERLDSAIQAEDILMDLAKHNPEDLAIRFDLARSRWLKAHALMDLQKPNASDEAQKNFEDSRKHYKIAIADIDELIDTHRENRNVAAWTVDLAQAHLDFGDLLLFRLNERTLAMAQFQEALKLFLTVRKSRSDDSALASHDVAWAENKVADVLHRQGDIAGARDLYQKAAKDYDALGDHLEDRLDWRAQLALIKNNIGWLLRKEGQFSDAIRSFEQADKDMATMVARQPTNLDYKSQHAWILDTMGETYLRWTWADSNPEHLAHAQEFLDQAATRRREITTKRAKRGETGHWISDETYTQASLNALEGTLKRHAVDLAAAAASFEQAAKLNEDVPPEDDFTSMRSILFLRAAADARAELRDATAAEKDLRKALELVEKKRCKAGDPDCTHTAAYSRGEDFADAAQKIRDKLSDLKK